MTLDEAITKYNKLANNDRTCYPEEAQQLAEWLEELKMYKSLAPRELVSAKQKNDRAIEYSKGFNFGFKTGYNKSIDDFSKRIKQVTYTSGTESDGYYKIHAICERDIDEIAEQLKAGDRE